jgi:hypothetical protein
MHAANRGAPIKLINARMPGDLGPNLAGDEGPNRAMRQLLAPGVTRARSRAAKNQGPPGTR